MNILYVSNLPGTIHAGPTYSVPKQIEAQAKIDNVFWYNTVKEEIAHWEKHANYHSLKEYPICSISCLPEPFNSPDLVIIEGFYSMFSCRIRKELEKGQIPYLIIPRGEFTKQAQERKKIKKVLANQLILRRFVRKALAIQFLTEQERNDSERFCNKTSIVVPNGIDPPSERKLSFSINEIRCISIGRIEPYQKGLDLLIEACYLLKDELIKANCTITIYGPNVDNTLKELRKLVIEKELQAVIFFKAAIFGDEKNQALLSSDVYLLPSRFEGHPMALIEALSYGLPCLATTGSNMRKEIDKADAGWTSESTSEGIAVALKRMLVERDQFFSKSTNAVVLADSYKWTKIAEYSHLAYKSLIKDG